MLGQRRRRVGLLSLPWSSPGSLPPSPRGGENQEPEGHPSRRVSRREAPSRAGLGGESLSRGGARSQSWSLAFPPLPPSKNPPEGLSNFSQPEYMRTVRTELRAGSEREARPGEAARPGTRQCPCPWRSCGASPTPPLVNRSPARAAVLGQRRRRVGLLSLPWSSPGSLPPSPRGGENQEPEGHPSRRVSRREAPSRAGLGGESLSRGGARSQSWSLAFPPLPPSKNPPEGLSNFSQPEYMRTVRTELRAGSEARRGGSAWVSSASLSLAELRSSADPR